MNPNFNLTGEDYGLLLDALYEAGYNAFNAGDSEREWDENSRMDQWDDSERSAFWDGWDFAKDDAHDNDDGDSGDFADGEWLASAGMGTDEDYGYYGGDD